MSYTVTVTEDNVSVLKYKTPNCGEVIIAGELNNIVVFYNPFAKNSIVADLQDVLATDIVTDGQEFFGMPRTLNQMNEIKKWATKLQDEHKGAK